MANTINDLSTYGATYDNATDASTAFQSAIAAGGTIGISGPAYLNPSSATTFTVPASVGLFFTPNGRLKLGPNATLNVVGHVDAGPTQIFDLSGGGAVTTTADCRTPVTLPEWWGAVASSPGSKANDSAPAVQACQTFNEKFGGTMSLRGVVYTCNSTIYVNGTTRIIGANHYRSLYQANSTTLDFTGASAASHGIVVNNVSASQPLYGFHLQDIGIVRVAAPTSGTGSFALYLFGVWHGEIHNCFFSNFDGLTHLNYSGQTQANGGNKSAPCLNVLFDGCVWDSYYTRAIYHYSASACEWRNCAIHSVKGVSEVVWIGPNTSFTNDTALFVGCQMGNVGTAQVIVRVLGGFYHTFRDCDVETASQAGIVFGLNYQSDATAPIALIDNCWFDRVGINVYNYGFLCSFAVTNCHHMQCFDTYTANDGVSVPAAPAAIYVNDSGQVLRAGFEVSITNCQIINYGSNGTCMILDYTNAANVQNNKCTMNGNSAQPSIILAAGARNVVTGNRISNAATIVSSSGSGDTITPNYVF